MRSELVNDLELGGDRDAPPQLALHPYFEMCKMHLLESERSFCEEPFKAYTLSIYISVHRRCATSYTGFV